LEQSKFFGFILRGSRMDIITSENRTIGSIDAPFGSAFAGRGNYYTYHMTNETGAVTSYARFRFGNGFRCTINAASQQFS
jgi:hypothetical protein